MVGNLVRIAGLLAVALPMAVSHASASEEVFKHPKVGGNRLDWCFKFQNGCGEKAANAWCWFSMPAGWEMARWKLLTSHGWRRPRHPSPSSRKARPGFTSSACFQPDRGAG